MGFHSPRFPHLPKNLSVFLITNIKIILTGPMSRFRWQVPLWQQILILDELGFPVDSCPRLTIPTACLRNYLLFRSKEICKMLNAGMLELYYVLVWALLGSQHSRAVRRRPDSSHVPLSEVRYSRSFWFYIVSFLLLVMVVVVVCVWSYPAGPFRPWDHIVPRVLKKGQNEMRTAS